MKNYILLLISILIIGCTSFKPVYKTGSCNDINLVIDSISKADSIHVVPYDRWITTDYITGDNSLFNLRSFYKVINKRTYIITAYKDSIYHWTYRIE